jgi:hypothetical protein
MNRRQTERDKRRTEAAREELVERMASARPDDGFSEVYGGVYLARESGRTAPLLMVHEPAFRVVAQGSKRVLLGDQIFKWDTGHYLLVTVDLPIAFEVERASAERPYLGLRLDLDASLVASVLMEAGVDVKRATPAVKAIDVGVVDAGLLDAVLRLVRLIDEPDEQKVLAPLVMKEIVFRLVSAGHAARLSHMLASGGATSRGCATTLRDEDLDALLDENDSLAWKFRQRKRRRCRGYPRPAEDALHRVAANLVSAHFVANGFNVLT